MVLYIKKAKVESACASLLKLRLNKKTQIGKIKNGVDFLGFNHKLTATGKVVQNLRASGKKRQKKYLKTISYYYLKGILDDEYINIRKNAFSAHLKGTADRKYIINQINALRRKKRALMAKDE